jgi:uncharacterized membrane protein
MSTEWTDDRLAALPRRNGFRMRGESMTRLETFCDAAFAFAVTMLVIAGGSPPASFRDLVEALKEVPAFAAGFASIASFWAGHRTWSRRYGLVDGASTLISLALVFVVLVYVYPLKMMFSTLFAWISGGWLPTTFQLDPDDPGGDLLGIFVVYGLGFAALTSLISLLNVRARRAADHLALNAYERLRTDEEIVSFCVLAATGLASALWAAVMPGDVAVFAGFVYITLPATMPAVAIRYGKRAKALLRESDEEEPT